MLREGGNAVDAALAAMLTSFVTEALLTGLGAGGYMLVAGPGLEPVLLDFFVAAPTRRGDGTEAELLAVDVSFGDAAQVFHIGPASCGAYGTPAGICAAAARWGTVPLARLAAPAAAPRARGRRAQCRAGLRREILADLLISTPECAALWAPHGTRSGARARSCATRSWLTRSSCSAGRAPSPSTAARSRPPSATGWASAAARSRPPTSPAIEALAREPVRVGYRDREILTNPPPSAGGVLLAYALGLLDREPAPPSLRSIVAAMAAAQSERTGEFLDGLAERGLPAAASSRAGSAPRPTSP